MIIDLIIDRQESGEYNAHDFYMDVLGYMDLVPEDVKQITLCMDEGDEQDVKFALCRYVLRNGYSEEICKYIYSVNWLT